MQRILILKKSHQKFLWLICFYFIFLMFSVVCLKKKTWQSSVHNLFLLENLATFTSFIAARFKIKKYDIKK